MLDAFVAENREEIIRRCRAKVALRSIPTPTPAELEFGVPRFLDQLVDALRLQGSSESEIGTSAARHGRDLHLQGFTVSQVVHDYGDVCQSITDLALELKAPISVENFRTLNRCLDDAIASAVTEFGRNQGHASADGRTAHGSDRFALRDLSQAALLAFEAIKSGKVGIAGSTGTVLYRNLIEIAARAERALADPPVAQRGKR